MDLLQNVCQNFALNNSLFLCLARNNQLKNAPVVIWKASQDKVKNFLFFNTLNIAH
jgi:hypothetical protein